MGLTVLEVVLVAVTSVVLTILIESLRRPHLDIRIVDYADAEYENRPAKQARFLNLEIVIRPMPRLFRWLSREDCLAVSRCHLLSPPQRWSERFWKEYAGSVEWFPRTNSAEACG
jgi:hypothetical protein